MHCCAADVPVGCFGGPGSSGVLLDLDHADTTTWDEVAEAMEAGSRDRAGSAADRSRSTRTEDGSDRSLTERSDRSASSDSIRRSRDGC